MHRCQSTPSLTFTRPRHVYTVAWFTLCYGWRVGFCKYIVIVTATAAPTSDLTLPYLTLPYLTLPYLILSYLILSRRARAGFVNVSAQASYPILSYPILSYLITQSTS